MTNVIKNILLKDLKSLKGTNGLYAKNENADF